MANQSNQSWLTNSNRFGGNDVETPVVICLIDSAGLELIDPVNDVWEKETVADEADFAGTTNRFGRVIIT